MNINNRLTSQKTLSAISSFNFYLVGSHYLGLMWEQDKTRCMSVKVLTGRRMESSGEDDKDAHQKGIKKTRSGISECSQPGTAVGRTESEQ